MKKQRSPLAFSILLLGCALAMGAGTTAPAAAQNSGDDNSSYQVADRSNDPAGSSNADASNTTANSENTGPVRLARFSYVQGNVTWRADSSLDWSQATDNMPLRQGAQIWITNGGRAEIQFDDGSVLRLGNGSLVTLNTLFSDAEGEFTQVTLNDGLATMKARHEKSIYQIDTPLVSAKITGPSRVRIGVSDGVELAVQQGRATIEGAQGKQQLNSGDYLDLQNADSSYNAVNLPSSDNWDRWNDDRDRILEDDGRPLYQHLPSNIALVAGDLDDCGSWHNDASYGWVWAPRVSDADWRPYHNGHWTWVNPFGWTWVSDESWGWAPYHYGSWVHASYGWAWCPGPSHQYWCPAVVHFSEYNNSVAWVPLAPREVHYPSVLSLGFHSGNWSLFFSIGQAAVYYPTATYWAPRPYNTVYVNHVTNITNVTNVTNITNINNSSYNRYLMSSERYGANRGGYLNRSIVPINARYAGGSVASVQAFGGRGLYRPLAASQTAYFAQGRSMAAPTTSRAVFAGPMTARPTLAALTPTRTMISDVRPPRAVMTREAYHAPLPAMVRRSVGASAMLNRPQPSTMDRRPISRVQPSRDAGRISQTDRMGASSSQRQNATLRTHQPGDNSNLGVRGSEPYVRRSRPTGGSAADAAAAARESLGMSSGRRTGQSRTSISSDQGSRRTTDRTNGMNRLQTGGDRGGARSDGSRTRTTPSIGDRSGRDNPVRVNPTYGNTGSPRRSTSGDRPASRTPDHPIITQERPAPRIQSRPMPSSYHVRPQSSSRSTSSSRSSGDSRRDHKSDSSNGSHGGGSHP